MQLLQGHVARAHAGRREDQPVDAHGLAAGEAGERHRAAHALAEHDQRQLGLVGAQRLDDVGEVLHQGRRAGPGAARGGLAEAALIIGDEREAALGEPGPQAANDWR